MKDPCSSSVRVPAIPFSTPSTYNSGDLKEGRVVTQGVVEAREDEAEGEDEGATRRGGPLAGEAYVVRRRDNEFGGLFSNKGPIRPSWVCW